MTLDSAINAFAVAIAYAEGFYVNGSRAQRNNNPGNITLDITNEGIGKDGPFIIYATAEDGWQALKKQVSMILNNTSGIYNSEMTIAEIAEKYTATEQAAWAMNVASKLGISPTTKISSLLTTATAGISGIVVLIALVLYFKTKK